MGAALPGPEAVRKLHADQRKVREHLLLHLRRSSPATHRSPNRWLKKRMTTIYVDRKRVAGSDSDFEVDLEESLHLQSDARLAVYKILPKFDAEKPGSETG